MQPRPEVRAQPIATVPGQRSACCLPIHAARWRVARFAAATVALTALVAPAWIAPACAQVGLGAERYEVTITPPKRPGTETPTADTLAVSPPAATANETLGAMDAPGAGAAVSPDANAAPGAPPVAKAGSAGSSVGAGSATLGAAAAEVPAPVTARANANLPQRTLQVGAFRQHKSALAMRDKLAASFQDVAIVEVQSGGEVLYRVNVGRMPRGAGLDDLRRRVIAAGHPAFEVPAPSLPAGE